MAPFDKYEYPTVLFSPIKEPPPLFHLNELLWKDNLCLSAEEGHWLYLYTYW